MAGNSKAKKDKKKPQQATVGFGEAASAPITEPSGETLVEAPSHSSTSEPSEPPAPPLPRVAIWSGDALLTSDLALNSDGFKSGGRLQIDDLFYQVLFDPPAIKSLKLHKSRIVAGCPYVPQVELMQNSLCAVATCRVEWYRSTNALTDKQKEAPNKKLKIEKLVQGWEKVGSEFPYTPTDDDVGRLLKVRCFPVKDDADHFVELISPVPVSQLPLADGECFPFEKRQRLTSEYCDPAENGAFRMVSYNLLADYYADSDFSRTSLFAYCPPEWLHGEYRRQLLLREIPGYRPDIVIMQEVDRKMFRNGLTSILGNQGMTGSLALKKEVPEGLATFWR